MPHFIVIYITVHPSFGGAESHLQRSVHSTAAFPKCRSSPAPRASSPLHVAFSCEEIQGPSATLAHETILCFLRQDHGLCLTQLDELPCFTNTSFRMSIIQHHIVKLRTPYTSFLRNNKGLVSKSPMNCFEERKAARHQSTALQDIPLAAIP